MDLLLAYLGTLGPGPMPDAAAPGLAGYVAYDLAAALWQGMGWGCFWAGVLAGVVLCLAVVVLILAAAALKK